MIDLDTVYNEDCLEGMKRIPDGSIDCIICDLPYGTTRNKWDSVLPLDRLWTQYRRVAKPNAAIVLFAQCPFDKVLGCSNLPMLKYEWIWQKEMGTGFLNSKKMPLKDHENILVFYDSPPTYNPQMTPGKPYRCKNGRLSADYGSRQPAETINLGERYPTTIVKFNRDRGLHPTQKPVDLVAYLVRTYSNEGDTVLDNCIGSGTTAVACIRENRHFIGFESDEGYFELARKRIEDETRKLKEPPLQTAQAKHK